MREARRVQRRVLPDDVRACDALGWAQSDRADAIDGDGATDALGWPRASAEDACGPDGVVFDDVL